jgi:hypothetical protein
MVFRIGQGSWPSSALLDESGNGQTFELPTDIEQNSVPSSKIKTIGQTIKIF